VEGENGRVEALGIVRLDADQGRLYLRPIRWQLTSAEESINELETRGEVLLAAIWSPGTEWEEVLQGVTFAASGAVDASLANPFLAGGVAVGRLELEARVRPGEVTLEAARARLNRGELRVAGGVNRAEGVNLQIELEDVRYRLDHGLTTLMNADLRLTRAPDTPARLTGDLVIERGALRRDLQLDRQILSLLFGPRELESAEPGALDKLQLDITLSTLEGVWVRNNLADLRVDWNPARIQGTLGQPLVRGRFDLDPGGRMTAFGQTVRIDEGSLILSGDPDIEPRLILETTSSLEDPSLNQDERWYADTGWGSRGAWETGFFGPGEGDTAEALTAGVTTHYTERLAAAMGSSLTGTEISYQALPLFGESNTEARWNLSQRISPRVTYINSRNPREAEGTTNLVELHGFAFAPSVIVQLFENDQGNRGATLQQVLQLGGGKATDSEPRLGRLRVEAPKGVSRRRARQAAGFRRGDPFPEGSDFDVEIDISEHMRRTGFPGARVRARAEPPRRGLVDVEVIIDPGPVVRAVFEGDIPVRARRRDIALLYQPERLAEGPSIAEMRRATVQALRGQGFIEPEVALEVELDDPQDPTGARTVRVRSDGGRRIDPVLLEFDGVDEETETVLLALFDTLLERVELAAGTPGADAFLKQSLRRLGYPDAQVTSRQISGDGRELMVSVDPGPQRRIGAVEVVGMPPAEANRLSRILPLSVGEPLRAEALTRAAAAIDDDLRRRGHTEARVDVELKEMDPELEEIEVGLIVQPGPSYRVAEVRLEGLRATDPQWAENVAGIELEGVLTADAIGDARRRLHRTGIFRSIAASSAPLDESLKPDPVDPMSSTAAAVTLDLRERPRFSLSYGGRWESGEAVGGAVYFTDRNFLGRGRTMGIRGIYMGTNDRSVGVYHAWPQVGGSKALLELFAEAGTEVDSRIITEGVEGWAQVTLPLSARRQTRFYTLYQDREFTAEEPDLKDLLDEDAVNLFLGWQFVFDTRDRALGLRAQRGLFVGFDLSASSEALGSDFGEVRLFAQGKLFQPVGPERLHRRSELPLNWAQSVRVGWLEPFEGVIPRVDRLTAGGEYSVRGYRTDSLGPLDEAGNPLGGEVFFVLNEELHVPLWRDIAGVAFFDAGNVWATSSQVDSDLFTSVGVGLRSPSPIGPLRLDVAFALDRRPDIDPDYKIYLGFGPTF
jgi:outer membrane protein assembly factor BamA